MSSMELLTRALYWVIDKQFPGSLKSYIYDKGSWIPPTPPPLPEEEKHLNPHEQGQNPSVWDHIKTHSSSILPPASGRVSGGF